MLKVNGIVGFVSPSIQKINSNCSLEPDLVGKHSKSDLICPLKLISLAVIHLIAYKQKNNPFFILLDNIALLMEKHFLKPLYCIVAIPFE